MSPVQTNCKYNDNGDTHASPNDDDNDIDYDEYDDNFHLQAEGVKTRLRASMSHFWTVTIKYL